MVTVMELTGHKDIRMLKCYAHTKEALKKEAMLKLNNLSKSLDLSSTGQDMGKIDYDRDISTLKEIS